MFVFICACVPGSDVSEMKFNSSESPRAFPSQAQALELISAKYVLVYPYTRELCRTAKFFSDSMTTLGKESHLFA